MLAQPASAFDTGAALVRSQLEALDGSFLNLAKDEEGPFWTYRHPTISDAFASYVAKSPELIEIYLRGARPESIIREVVCSGISLEGALVVVPNSLHDLLFDKLAKIPSYLLGKFISYRANKAFTSRLLKLRPDIWEQLDVLSRPLKDDGDVDLLITLYEQQLLPGKRRIAFVEEVRAAAIEDADDSFLQNEGIRKVLTDAERESILDDVEEGVIGHMRQHIGRVRNDWRGGLRPSRSLRHVTHLNTEFRGGTLGSSFCG